MPKYQRKDVCVGMMMQLDCSTATPVMIKRDGPPQYGSPPSFKNINDQLDAARKRLEEIAAAVRKARGGR